MLTRLTPSARIGHVPQQHPGRRAADAEEDQVRPDHRPEVRQPGAGQQSRRRPGRGRDPTTVDAAVAGTAPSSALSGRQHDRVGGEGQRAGQDQAGSGQRAVAARPGDRSRAGEHGDAGQGGGAAEPGPDAAALAEEQPAEHQHPDRLGGKQQSHGDAGSQRSPAVTEQVVPDKAEQPRGDQPAPAGAGAAAGRNADTAQGSSSSDAMTIRSSSSGSGERCPTTARVATGARPHRNTAVRPAASASRLTGDPPGSAGTVKHPALTASLL